MSNKKQKFMLHGIICGIVVLVLPVSGNDSTFLQMAGAPLSILATLGIIFCAWKVLSIELKTKNPKK